MSKFLIGSVGGDGPVSYVAIPVDAEYLDRLLDRLRWFDGLKREDAGLCNLEFWAHEVLWLDNLNDDAAEQLDDTDLCWILFECEDVLALHYECSREAKVDIPTVEVSGKDVQYLASYDGTDEKVFSPSLEKVEIEAFLEQLRR